MTFGRQFDVIFDNFTPTFAKGFEQIDLFAVESLFIILIFVVTIFSLPILIPGSVDVYGTIFVKGKIYSEWLPILKYGCNWFISFCIYISLETFQRLLTRIYLSAYFLSKKFFHIRPGTIYLVVSFPFFLAPSLFGLQLFFMGMSILDSISL